MRVCAVAIKFAGVCAFLAAPTCFSVRRGQAKHKIETQAVALYADAHELATSNQSLKDGNATGFDLGEATYLDLDSLTPRGDPATSASQIEVQKFSGHSEAAADPTDQPTDEHEAGFKLPFTLMRNSSLLEERVWAGVPPAANEQRKFVPRDTVLKILAVTYAPGRLVAYIGGKFSDNGIYIVNKFERDGQLHREWLQGWIIDAPEFEEGKIFVTLVQAMSKKKGSRLPDEGWSDVEDLKEVPQNLTSKVPLKYVRLARQELDVETLYRSETDSEPPELQTETLKEASVGTRQYAVLDHEEVLERFEDMGLLFPGSSKHTYTPRNATKVIDGAIKLVEAVRGVTGLPSPSVVAHPDDLHSGALEGSIIVRGTKSVKAAKTARHLHRNFSSVVNMKDKNGSPMMGCNVWVPISPPMGGDSNKRLLVMPPSDSFNLLQSFSFLFDHQYPDLHSGCAEDILTHMVLKPSAFEVELQGMTLGPELVAAAKEAKEALRITPKYSILVFLSGAPSVDEPFHGGDYGLLHTAWNPGEPEDGTYLNFDVHLAVSVDYFEESTLMKFKELLEYLESVPTEQSMKFKELLDYLESVPTVQET